MLTLATARDEAKKLILEFGRDFIYNTDPLSYECFYQKISSDDPNDNRTKMACIVGAILSAIGETRHLESSQPVITLARDFPDMFSLESMQYCVILQGVQDKGYSWGAAYEAAESWYWDIFRWQANIRFVLTNIRSELG